MGFAPKPGLWLEPSPLSPAPPQSCLHLRGSQDCYPPTPSSGETEAGALCCSSWSTESHLGSQARQKLGGDFFFLFFLLPLKREQWKFNYRQLLFFTS